MRLAGLFVVCFLVILAISNTANAQTPKQSVTLTLYVYDGPAKANALSGVKVSGLDGAGHYIGGTTISGYVTLSGTSGCWLFTIQKSGFKDASWSKAILSTSRDSIYFNAPPWPLVTWTLYVSAKLGSKGPPHMGSGVRVHGFYVGPALTFDVTTDTDGKVTIPGYAACFDTTISMPGYQDNGWQQDVKPGQISYPYFIAKTEANPLLSVTPEPLSFESVNVGSWKDLDFTLTNTGGGTIIGTASTNAPFSFVGTASPVTTNFTVDRNPVSVRVRFSPTSLGSFTGRVTFSSNGGNLSRTVSGTGVGVSPPANPIRNLTVASANPNSGVSITVNPIDRNGLSNGTTPFNLTYDKNAVVTLEAPSIAGGNIFQKWQRNGVDYTIGSLSANVAMDADYTMTAVYVSPPSQSNRPPVINSFIPTALTVRPRDTVILNVSASDPENDPLTYSWSASCGALSSTTGPNAKTWTAPGTTGTCTVEVRVTDNKPGHSPVSQSARIEITQLQQKVTLTLYVHEAGYKNRRVQPLSDARVVVTDGSGVTYDRTTAKEGSAIGSVSIEGTPGNWSFTVSKQGYNTKMWSQPMQGTKLTRYAFLFPKKITAAMDIELLNLIDDLIKNKKYYDDNAADGAKWKLSLSQFKAWVVTIATCEGGNAGYGAHSRGNTGTDVFYHSDSAVGSKFRFSTGIGPFQIDNGGHDSTRGLWDTWSTIDKLDRAMALETVLNEHYVVKKNQEISLLDFQVRFSQTWYGVLQYPQSENGDVEACWNMVTGTDWDDHKSNGTQTLDWDYIKQQLATNAQTLLGWNYKAVRQDKGTMKWDISDGISFSGDKKTWLIQVTKQSGDGDFKYYYSLDEAAGIEVWVWDNSGDPNKDNWYKYAFFRKYRTSQKPENLVGVTAGLPLSKAAIAIVDCNSVTATSAPSSITYNPRFLQSASNIIYLTVSNGSGASRTVSSITPQSDEPFRIVKVSPSLPSDIKTGNTRRFTIYTVSSQKATATAPYFVVKFDNGWNTACSPVQTAGEAQLLESLNVKVVQSVFWANQLHVKAIGSGIHVVRLQMFDLSGRLVLDRTADGNELTLSPSVGDRRPMAAGVYLYVIQVRGLGRDIWVSAIRKLLVLH